MIAIRRGVDAVIAIRKGKDVAEFELASKDNKNKKGLQLVCLKNTKQIYLEKVELLVEEEDTFQNIDKWIRYRTENRKKNYRINTILPQMSHAI